MAQHFIAIHASAPNDSNGNPRRLYILLDAGQEYLPIHAVAEEGYYGGSAMNSFERAGLTKGQVKKLKRFVFEVSVTPSEYGNTRINAKRHGVYYE